MITFDQRSQQVTRQYNAAGDINFGAVQNKIDMVDELKKLLAELATATAQHVLDEEAAIDAESALKKALRQAEQPNPNKTTLLKHLNQAKNIVSGVAALVGAFNQAMEKVRALF